MILLVLMPIHPPCFRPPIHAGDYLITAKVEGVTDGDTITVLKDFTQFKIRLHGIDCPEKSQAFGTKARQFTSSMVFGKTVTVKPTDTDRYGSDRCLGLRGWLEPERGDRPGRGFAKDGNPRAGEAWISESPNSARPFSLQKEPIL